MSGYEIAQLDQVEETTDGRCPWRPLRAHLGVRAFGITSWTARAAGDRIINEHSEAPEDGDSQEELYFVHSGRARFEIDGEPVDAPAGALVFVQPGVKRTAFAEQPGTTVIAIGGTAGEAYRPNGWDLWAPVRPLYEAGQYEQAAERLATLVAEHPEYPDLAYNLACCESLAGRAGDAIAHLRVAVEVWDGARAMAAKDSDFDPIREQPGFRELVG